MNQPRRRSWWIDFLRDENGAEMIEYVIVLGLVLIGATAMVGVFGVKLMARWTSINNSM